MPFYFSVWVIFYEMFFDDARIASRILGITPDVTRDL